MRAMKRGVIRGRRLLLRKPRRLRSGGVIGIAAPASPFDRESFDRGVQVLHDMGFETMIPDGLSAAEGYLAGPDGHRAAVLQQLFEDAHIDAIICARGGYGSMRILPLLDYDQIAAHPKVFVGFSDVSALLSVITRRCGFVGVLVTLGLYLLAPMPNLAATPTLMQVAASPMITYCPASR